MTGDYYALLRVDSAAISCYTYPVCYYPPERSRITLNKSEFISAIGNRTLKRDADIKPIIDAALTKPGENKDGKFIYCLRLISSRLERRYEFKLISH